MVKLKKILWQREPQHSCSKQFTNNFSLFLNFIKHLKTKLTNLKTTK
jgi:hypothetical protein